MTLVLRSHDPLVAGFPRISHTTAAVRQGPPDVTHHEVLFPLRVAGAAKSPRFVDDGPSAKPLLALVAGPAVESDLGVELELV